MKKTMTQVVLDQLQANLEKLFADPAKFHYTVPAVLDNIEDTLCQSEIPRDELFTTKKTIANLCDIFGKKTDDETDPWKKELFGKEMKKVFMIRSILENGESK